MVLREEDSRKLCQEDQRLWKPLGLPRKRSKSLKRNADVIPLCRKMLRFSEPRPGAGSDLVLLHIRNCPEKHDYLVDLDFGFLIL